MENVKRDSKGRFVKTKPSREDLQAKIASLEKTKAILEEELACALKERKTWKQEYDEIAEVNRGLKKYIEKLESRSKWMYMNLTFWKKAKFRKLFEALVEL